MTTKITDAPEPQPEPSFAEMVARYRREHSRLARAAASVLRSAAKFTRRNS